MSELAFVTTTYTFESQWPRMRIPTEVVAGVTSGLETALAHNWQLGAAATEHVIELDSKIADGLVDFYRQTFSKPPSKRPSFDSHSLAAVVAGAAFPLPKSRELHIEPTALEAGERLTAGQTYAILDSARQPQRSLIGLGKGSDALSIIGRDELRLCIADSFDLRELSVGYYTASTSLTTEKVPAWVRAGRLLGLLATRKVAQQI